MNQFQIELLLALGFGFGSIFWLIVFYLIFRK